MDFHNLWKQEGIRWKEECKRNRYQKDQWNKISEDLLSQDAFRIPPPKKCTEKGVTPYAGLVLVHFF